MLRRIIVWTVGLDDRRKSSHLGYYTRTEGRMAQGFGLTAILLVMVPETRTGILLQRRAKKLRKETGDQDYFAEHETLGQRPLGQMIKETLWRPVCMCCLLDARGRRC